MKIKLLFELDIDSKFKITVHKKNNYYRLHNDSFVYLEHLDNKYLLTDSSFTDEFGYSMYYRFFNIKEFSSIEEYVQLYEKELKNQKNGVFNSNFDDSYLFVCTSIQQKVKDNDNYFLTINLIKIIDKYILMFIEGDYEKCKVNVLKHFILTTDLIEKWKKIMTKVFEFELKKEFLNYNSFKEDDNLEREFKKFIDSIKNR